VAGHEASECIFAVIVVRGKKKKKAEGKKRKGEGFTL
jgi:hypothetical protein